MKKIYSILTLVFVSFFAFGFDWPQEEIMSDTFFAYFAHTRGGVINPSLIFSDSGEIKTSSKGTVTAVLSEHDEDSSLFESTLGNAVILVHDDSLMTVYANLNSDDQEKRYELSEVENATAEAPAGRKETLFWNFRLSI